MILTFYMKSGNRIRVRGVKEYTINNAGNEIIGLSLKYYWFRFGKRLLVKTMDLSQIEAVTVG